MPFWALLLGLSLEAPPLLAQVWPNTVDRVARALASEDVEERRGAAGELLRLPKASAEKLLPQLLADDDVEVRIKAAEAVVEFRFAGGVLPVSAWLSEREARLRLAAAQLLGRFPATRESVQALSRALNDADIEVRVAAAQALGRSADNSAVLSLLGHLDEANLKVQLEVLAALTRLRDARAVMPLVGKVQDARAPVREAVARALGNFSAERASSALVLLLRDADEAVRLAAVSALGRTGPGSALDALLQVLHNDPSLDVRVAAVDALGRAETSQAVEVLIELLDGPRLELAEEAKRALSRMGPVANPPLLLCLAGQPSRPRADGCAYAVARLAPQDASLAIGDAWRRRIVSAEAALDAFAVLRDPRSLPLALESLTDEDPWVRHRAVAAVAVLLDPDVPEGRAVEPLLLAASLAADRPEELLALVGLLGKTGSPRVASQLAVYAVSSRLRLRLAALRSLGSVRAKDQQALLLQALDDAEPRVRQEAALALRRASQKSAAGPLLARLARASERDAPWLALALAGPLADNPDASTVAAVAKLLPSSSGAVRDALVEALVRARSESAVAALAQAAEQLGLRTRAKVAEVFAGVPEQRALLVTLLKDVEPVRANAVWALGFVGNQADLPVLAEHFADPSLQVAANAALAYGRVAQRLRVSAEPLCSALRQPRAAVRANALVGLRLAATQCGAAVGQLLSEDPSPLVRRAAASLLTANVSVTAAEREALQRCSDEERDGRVALACLSKSAAYPLSATPVTVFVFGPSSAEPVPNSPFALEFADGSVRYGLSDRRGALSEPSPPQGALRLQVPLQEDERWD